VGKKPTIAIIGRPNVGKSTLFNRIIQKHDAIVDSTPGVTRDRIYGNYTWLNKEHLIIDTGGIRNSSTDNFQDDINLQATLAMEEADVILFVTDFHNKDNHTDLFISKKLKNFDKEIIIVVNKYDQKYDITDSYKWKKFGFGDPFYISASHGINVGILLNHINKLTKNFEYETDQNKQITFSFIGKPNVGKSSIMNSILNTNQLLTSDIPGTTRDSIYIDLDKNDKKYTLVDTAGIKRKSKLNNKIDQISLIKTKLAIERSDITILVFDASNPISTMDLNIAGLLKNSNKPIIIILNKTDLLSKEEKEIFKKKLKEQLKFLSNFQFLFYSAKYSPNVGRIFKSIDILEQACKVIYSNSQLSKFINNLLLIKPPASVGNKTAKIYKLFQKQYGLNIPTFFLEVSDPKLLSENYTRFLINKIISVFKIEYVAIKLKVIKRK